MEHLIPVVSKLQDVLGALGQTTHLDLPQIVVVGGQSSGKSSVLENIVGRSFLPRGTGIVTRRPLVLQLFNTRQAPSDVDEIPNKNRIIPPGGSAEEWGEFLHLPGKRMYDFADIRREIADETNRITGNNKGVDSTPINLKIFSPRVVSLTLVDLPGIAKVPVGDQPEDIERQINSMCMSFISNPNAIILAVTSANTDLANSDALKLAQAVDPEGLRTIGVLTKVDLMDEGTDCTEILLNQVIPLRRGYIAVVNRGQKDVVSDVSIRDGLKKEENFFRKHPIYSRDRSILSKCGTGRLSKNLNSILMHHIRDCLPDLKTRIAHMMADVQKELDTLGTAAESSNKTSRGGTLLSLLSKFATNFTKILDGHVGEDLDTRERAINGSKSSGGRGCVELLGGARISYIFTSVFATSLNSVGAFDGLTDEEIRTIIANANGTRPALFVPEISFDIIVRRQLTRLEQPGVECVDLVYEELQRIAGQAEPSELTRFPILRDRMVEVVSSLLRRCVTPTQMMVTNLVKIELAYINTSHPDFIGGSKAVARLMDKTDSKENERKRVTNGRGSAGPLSPSGANNVNADGDEFKDALGSPSAEKDHSGLMNFIFGSGENGAKPGPVVEEAEDGPPVIVHLPQMPVTMKQTDFPITDREAVEMAVIKSLVDSYFGIVRKNFIDMVPKVRPASYLCMHSVVALTQTATVLSPRLSCTFLSITFEIHCKMSLLRSYTVKGKWDNFCKRQTISHRAVKHVSK
jgi:dynamin 1-like protein